MVSNARKRVYRRGFLNDDRGMAAYETDIELWHEGLSSISFKLSDCNRQVSLDLSYDNAEAKTQINNKIQRLIDELIQIKSEINEDSTQR